MMGSAAQGLVSPSDVADIAGVSRSAVSNWRRRADDFPEPVGGSSAKPLFSREAVTEWLVNHGHTPRADHGETGAWAAMNTLRSELSADDAAEFILSLTCARKLTGQSVAGMPEGKQWADLTSQPPSGLKHELLRLFRELDPTGNLLSSETLIRHDLNPQALAPVVDVLGGADLRHLGSIADFALERLAKAQAKVGAYNGFVGSRTSAILARLAAARQAAVLYDPACGIAAGLLAAVEYGARPVRIVGHDIDERALRIARQRALLHDVEVEFVQTNVIREDIDPALRADVVIAEPPFGLRLDAPAWLTDHRFQFGPPPRTSADTAWLQHVIAHLAEAGSGYVITPMGPLSREGEERAIRTELIRSGCVEAIVGLPGKMLPHTSIPLALWILRRPAPVNATSQILLIDAGEEESPEAHVAAWVRSEGERSKIPHANVSITDILAADSVLSPQRWTARTDHQPQELSRAYMDGRAAIQDALRELEHSVSSYQDPPEPGPSRVLTVAELIDHGVLDLRSGRPADHYEDLPDRLRTRIITAGDVRDGNLRDVPRDVEPGELPALTQPGDVLVTTMHTVRARVDHAGCHIPSTGVYRLRILDHHALLNQYLVLALTGSWNARFQSGSTIQRAPIRSLEIPLVPIHDQRNIALAVTAAEHIREEGATLARQAGLLGSTLLDVVRYNAWL